MKVKLKFDMDKVKEFAIEHGEKFVLAGAVLLLGVFIVKAASRDTLPESLEPSAIEKQSQAATDNVKRLAVPPPAQDVTPINLSLVGKEVGFGSQGVDIGPIVQQPFPDLVKRVDPTLLPVEELRVAEFRGGVPVSRAAIGNIVPVPAPGPMIPPLGGLVPGKAPAARPGVRAGAGVAGRPGVGLPANGLVANGAAAQGPVPFPPDFHPPGPQSTGFAEGRYGIVITGLIPTQAQREEYARRFKNARRGVMVEGASGASRGRDRAEIDADSPQYVWCWLERTDTTEGKTTVLDFGDIEQIRQDYKQPDKSLLDRIKEQVQALGMGRAIQQKLEAEVHRWAVPGGEVVDKEYLAEKWFSWPLPPVLLRNWGAEAAHPPKIPLAAPVAMTAPGEVPPGQTLPGGNDFTDPSAPGLGPERRHVPAGLGARAEAAEVPYKLFRFVDLDVEPGHAYQYRVRMLLRNPNFGLEAQVLLKPKTATVAYRQTPWSEMSASVLIPQNTRLLGGSIDRPRRMEPKAKVSVFTFDPVQAIELIKEFDTELGALVGTSVPDQVVKGVADPVIKEIHDMTGKFRTASVLLDFRGNDEKLPGAMVSDGVGPPVAVTDPAEMLLLDDIDHPENPRLIVVNEAKDKPIIDEWKKTHIAPAAPVVAVPGANPAKPGPVKAGGGLIPGGGLLPPKAGNPTRRPTTRPN